MRSHQLDLPCVLLERDAGLEVVFAKADLDGMDGDLSKFAAGLKSKL